MIDVYEIGPDRTWTGEVGQIAERAALVGNWTRAVPPALSGDEVAQFDGVRWRVTTQEAIDAETLRKSTPREISDRQFFTALWKDGGRITYEEALAAVATGTIPTTMIGFLDLLATYDEDGAKDARLLLSGATTFERDNYLIPVFGSMYGMSEEQIDALWRLGKTL